jgi:hypothetical protein
MPQVKLTAIDANALGWEERPNEKIGRSLYRKNLITDPETGMEVRLARSRRQSPLHRVSTPASDIASRVGSQARPWMNLGLSAATALASAVSTNKARGRTIRGINGSTDQTINTVTDGWSDCAR